jgi:NADH-quinone oxidoreductase subunit C
MTDSVQTTPAERLDALAKDLTSHFAGYGCELLRHLGELTLVLPAERLLEAARVLRGQAVFHFEQLVDLCGVDYGTYGQGEWETEDASVTGFGRGVDRDGIVIRDSDRRFAVVYHLLSIQHNMRLRLRVYAVGDLPRVDSVIGIWASANWFEREAFDLYGILFRGHPDLRRILTDYGFVGHPFRKDFPLIGQVEMRYDPEKRRVVYEPVSVEPRTLVPKVIREDNRLLRGEAAPQVTPPNA